MKRHILVVAVIPIAGLVAVTITDPTPKLPGDNQGEVRQAKLASSSR